MRGVEKFEDRLGWYRRGAERGSVEAMTSVGQCCESGEGVEQNFEEAANWYRKAADGGSAGGLLGLGRLYERGDGVDQSSKQAARCYLRAAETGLPEGMCSLGRLLVKGRGAVAGVNWLRKAAGAGDATAMLSLGLCHTSGRGAVQSFEEALTWYRKAAEAGSGDAMSNIGSAYQKGEGAPRDRVEAARWWRKAAYAGSVEGMLALGVAFKEGSGAERSDEEAVKWWHKAAEAGSMAAMFELACAYEFGCGTRRSMIDAEKWWGKLRNAGTGEEVAARCTSCTGVLSVDPVGWFRKGAGLGSAEAMRSIGQCYEKGEGLDRSLEEAVNWYRKAAESGSREAMRNLGLLYEGGQGVMRSVEDATIWYRKAAEEEDGVRSLGSRIIRPEDMTLEFKPKYTLWYSLAISQNGVFAVFLCNRLQTLPAEGSCTMRTVADNQSSLTFRIYEGEHLLCRKNKSLGEVVVEDLPLKPRGKVRVRCKITVHLDGSIKFVITETLTGQNICAQFLSRMRFRDVGLPTVDLLKEKLQVEAWRRRSEFHREIQRAEAIDGATPPFDQARRKWRDLYDKESEKARYDELTEARLQALTEFHELLPSAWRAPGWRDSVKRCDHKYEALHPLTRVTRVTNGATVIRFKIDKRYSGVFCVIEDSIEQRKPDRWANIAWAEIPGNPGMVEVFASVVFEADGCFSVRPSLAGPKGRAFALDDYVFVVAGAPGLWTPGAALVPAGRDYMPVASEGIKVRPIETAVFVEQGIYRGKLRAKGTAEVNVYLLDRGGRPGAGLSLELGAARSGPGGWRGRDFSVHFERTGAYEFVYFLNGMEEARQTVICGRQWRRPVLYNKWGYPVWPLAVPVKV
jgi:TPR repeat protein